MARRKVARAYLIGESAELFAEALSEEIAYEIAGTLDTAVQRAAAEATRGQAVVLSPACSSFDQFANFAERGKAFQRHVQALGAGGESHHGA